MRDASGARHPARRAVEVTTAARRPECCGVLTIVPVKVDASRFHRPPNSHLCCRVRRPQLLRTESSTGSVPAKAAVAFMSAGARTRATATTPVDRLLIRKNLARSLRRIVREQSAHIRHCRRKFCCGRRNLKQRVPLLSCGVKAPRGRQTGCFGLENPSTVSRLQKARSKSNNLPRAPCVVERYAGQQRDPQITHV